MRPESIVATRREAENARLMYTTLIQPARSRPHRRTTRMLRSSTAATSSVGRSGATRRTPQGHIPGAVQAHLDRDLSAADRPADRPPPAARCREARGNARAAGASTTTCRWSRTTRATAPTARARGGCFAGWATQNVAVLDGGLAAWQEAGAAGVARAGRTQTAHVHAASLEDGAFVTAAEVQQALANRVHRARRRARRRSLRRRERDHRPGRRPRARRDATAPSRRTSTPAAASLPAEELRRQWTRAPRHARRRGEVVAMCGSGVTACHNLLALEIAGHGRREALRRLMERVDP